MAQLTRLDNRHESNTEMPTAVLAPRRHRLYGSSRRDTARIFRARQLIPFGSTDATWQTTSQLHRCWGIICDSSIRQLPLRSYRHGYLKQRRFLNNTGLLPSVNATLQLLTMETFPHAEPYTAG